jgi:hypothetical protein
MASLNGGCNIFSRPSMLFKDVGLFIKKTSEIKRSNS